MHSPKELKTHIQIKACSWVHVVCNVRLLKMSGMLASALVRSKDADEDEFDLIELQGTLGLVGVANLNNLEELQNLPLGDFTMDRKVSIKC